MTILTPTPENYLKGKKKITNQRTTIVRFVWSPLPVNAEAVGGPIKPGKGMHGQLHGSFKQDIQNLRLK